MHRMGLDSRMHTPRHPRARLMVDCPLGTAGTVTLSEDQRHYLLHVMRVKLGDVLHLVNSSDGLWEAEVTEISKRDVVVCITQKLAEQRVSPNLTVCIAPVKGGRFESMIEKATELGARRIIAVKTKRTIISRINQPRLISIAREAAEQCERMDMPEISELTEFADLLANWPSQAPLIYGDESGAHGGFAPDAALTEAANTHGWGALIGPEGGFAPEELALLAKKNGACGVSLGPRILRADTACTSLCTVTLQHFGDWHARPAFRHAH